MTFSKFDTQIQIEETDFEPTAADLAELDAWIDELDSELDELDELDDYHMRACESEAEWYEEVDSFDRNATPPF